MAVLLAAQVPRGLLQATRPVELAAAGELAGPGPAPLCHHPTGASTSHSGHGPTPPAPVTGPAAAITTTTGMAAAAPPAAPISQLQPLVLAATEVGSASVLAGFSGVILVINN